ncbi:hypothetical protein pb186bvf_002249 [Paramecium bursaria]
MKKLIIYKRKFQYIFQEITSQNAQYMDKKIQKIRIIRKIILTLTILKRVLRKCNQ